MDSAFQPGERLYQGAEATLTLTSHFGRAAVVKLRSPKGYRIKELENAIARSRMRNEARLLRRAREAGVGAPAVLDSDPEAQSLTLEYLGREPLRARFEGMSPTARKRAAHLAGTAIGNLHRAGIIHGDLTTSNMMLNGETLSLIDFSLGHISEKLEDRAVDLKAFKDSFLATHHAYAADFSAVLSGYAKALGKGAPAVVRHIGAIERRRRYA